MNRISVYLDKDDNVIGFRMDGHANFDEYGKDIVCAALSVLSQNTYYSIIKLSGLEEKDVYCASNSKKGFLEVKLLKNSDIQCYEKALLLLKSFELGISIMADTYPQNVTLEYRRC